MTSLPRRALASALLMAGLVIAGLRATLDPVSPIGVGGGAWDTHLHRLQAVQAWRDASLAHPLRALLDADGGYPPLAHLPAALLGALAGHSVAAVNWTSSLWMALLALSAGVVIAAAARKPSLALPAAAAYALVPGLHAAASRSTFDLPMAALLWAAAAAFAVLVPKRPITGGFVAGLLWLAAGLAKWPGLPFGGPLLLGVALLPDGGSRKRRLAALAVSLAVAAGGARWWMSASPGSLGETISLSWAPGAGSPGWVGALARSLVPEALRSAFAHFRPAPDALALDRLAFYPRAALASVLSPAATLFAAPLWLLWLRRSRQGLGLVSAGLTLHLAFLLLLVFPLDDRFLLVSLPLLALPALLGWDELPDRSRTVVAALWVLLAGALAWDFHARGREDLTAPPRPEPVDFVVRERTPLVRWGLHSTWDHRGYARADEQRSPRLAHRERVWEAVRAERPWRIFVSDDAITRHGDEVWWRYRLLLDELEGRWSPPGGFLLGEPCDAPPPGSPRAGEALIVLRADAPPPRCLVGRPRERVARLNDPRGGPGTELWRITDGGSTPRSWTLGP